MKYLVVKFFKNFIIIILLVFVFDLFINLILPEKLKKKIGTSRNYSLKSEKFHHSIAANINVYEFWGKKKYKIKTNELSMRVGENESFFIDRSKKNIGFIGDSFVYGSGIDYRDHFISKIKKSNFNLLNLGYVSYSPSIYYKLIKNIIEKKRINFEKIFIFIDHSDIQDEAEFYREDKKGNIVRKWLNDDQVERKNKKYKIKNYLKQNSFIFKFYENISAPTISNITQKCIKKDNVINYKDYLDPKRFGYSYYDEIVDQKWVKEGINKSLNYLNKIKFLSKKYKFEIIIVSYPSALEVIDKINSENSKHFKFLNEWSLNNKVDLIDTRNDFIIENKPNNYLKSFIPCDVHWNKNGHLIISKNINHYINEKN